jgi:hypothetical protein
MYSNRTIANASTNNHSVSPFMSYLSGFSFNLMLTRRENFVRRVVQVFLEKQIPDHLVFTVHHIVAIAESPKKKAVSTR